MPVTLTTTAATGCKPCFAPSVNVGLCLMSNGQDQVQVIDPYGFIVPAFIPQPTVTPTVVDGGPAGQMTVGQWVCYVIVYGANRRYPYVEANAIGGKIYPRGNPSAASVAHQVPASGSCDVTITLPESIVRTDLTRVLIFRTLDMPSAAKAQAAAAAGDLYYTDRLGVPVNNPANQTFVYNDKFATPTDDLVEYDNYPAPQFQFCVFVDPYWWGFGNYQFPTPASWTDNGLVSFNDPNFVFNPGRYQQPCFVKSIGDDGDTTNIVRQFYAFPVAGQPNQAQLCTTLDGDLPGPNSGLTNNTGTLTFAGPSTTLYRSKYRNPMAWGTTDYVGVIRVPSQFYFRVGGGIGTGIAQVPNMPLLVLSTKNPPATYTLDLRTAGTAQFNATLRTISTLYSATSQFSQFPACTPAGAMCLWMHDGDNFVILACDGNSLVPISSPVSQTMRSLTSDKLMQQMVHGLYDPLTQMNCMWLARQGATGSMDILVMQHAPTGNWHTQFEGDVLSSATLQASICGLNANYVGTEKGIMGVVLDVNKTRNWLYETLVLAGTLNVTSQLSTAVPANSPGLIGSFILVTDQTGAEEQWGRIDSMQNDGVTFTVDKVWSPRYGWSSQWFRAPVENDPYFLGVIELSLLRYIDMGAFTDDHKLDELWVALSNVDTANPTFMQYFLDRLTNPLVLPGGKVNLPLTNVKQPNGVTSQQWFNKMPPSDRIKVFGLRLVDRGFSLLKVFAWSGKAK